MTNSEPPTGEEDFARRSHRVEPVPSAVEAHRILQSSKSLTLTAANKLGIRRLLTMTGERPVTITERGVPLGHVYSAEHWDAVFSATAELTSSALHALAEILLRLKPDELIEVVTPAMDVLEFHRESER